eukprot:9808638-Alexandrium_andersonii.AAC.1
MSASLVGSEMCIRDRGTSVRTEEALRGGAVSVRLTRCRGFKEGRSGPVSYTHLTLPTICSV